MLLDIIEFPQATHHTEVHYALVDSIQILCHTWICTSWSRTLLLLGFLSLAGLVQRCQAVPSVLNVQHKKIGIYTRYINQDENLN